MNIYDGAVRHKKDGEWVVTNPGTTWYSSAVMVAEEYYSDNKWHSMQDPTEAMMNPPPPPPEPPAPRYVKDSGMGCAPVILLFIIPFLIYWK